jgi:hypothetical protein
MYSQRSWCRMQIPQPLFAHWTTLNGHSFKPSRTISKCVNFGTRTSANPCLMIPCGSESVIPAFAEGARTCANSSWWQWERPSRHTMYTNMGNITMLHPSLKVSEKLGIGRVVWTGQNIQPSGTKNLQTKAPSRPRAFKCNRLPKA